MSDTDVMDPSPVGSRPAEIWGALATLALGTSVILIDFVFQIAVISGYWIKGLLNGESIETVNKNYSNVEGFILSIAVVLWTPLALGIIGFLISMRKGLSVHDYLRLNRVGPAVIGKWLTAGAVLVVFLEVVNSLFDRPLPEFMVSVYKTAYFEPLLWVAMVIAAPLFEETLFRGFIFEGLLRSRLKAPGAVLVTSLIFAVIHFQYQSFDLLSVFLMGLLFGAAKIATDSLYVPICMHAFLNLLAMIQTVCSVES